MSSDSQPNRKNKKPISHPEKNTVESIEKSVRIQNTSLPIYRKSYLLYKLYPMRV